MKKQTCLASGVLAAFGASAAWFDAGICNYESWPTDGNDKIVEGVGRWTGTDGAVLVGEIGARSLRVDAPNPLMFYAAEQKSVSTEGAEVCLSMNVRTSACGELPDIPDGAKGAFVLLDEESVTYGWGLVSAADGQSNVWMRLVGVLPDADTDYTFEIRCRQVGETLQVRYAVNGEALLNGTAEWSPVACPNGLSSIAGCGCQGCGSISSLTGDYTGSTPKATLTIPALAHVTVAHVKVAGAEVRPTDEGAYVVNAGSVVTVTFAPEPGWALDVAAMTFVVGQDMSLPETGRPHPVDVASVVTINEVMAKNGTTLRTETGFEGLDWVELYNSGDQAVDLTGWYFGNDPTKKPSKWKAIEGACVVPAKGYKILWCDGDGLCAQWATGEAHVVCNISTDAGKHTVFLAAAANASAIVQQIKLPGGVKDVSYGRGHLSRTLVSATSAAEYRVGAGEWKPVDGPVGMSAATGGFEVVTYKINKSVSNMDVADACILDPTTWASGYPVTNAVPALAFADDEKIGAFPPERYTDFPGVSGNNFVLVAKGAVAIPERGDWTFAVGSDDGFSAKITRLGRSWTWESRGGRSYAQSAATFNLEPGVYDVELRYFNNTGGLALDFSAAKGRLAFDVAKFALVGTGDIVHAGALGAQIATDVSGEMSGRSRTLDWRTTFMLDDAPNAADGFRLAVKYADGFVAKLNGTTVASVAATAARAAADVLSPVTFDIPASHVVQGANMLEITAENDAIDDTEFYLSAELVRDVADDMFVYFKQPTPGAANGGEGRTGFTPKVAFSVPHGYKDAPFDLALACPDNETAVIYYTLDGTSPQVGGASTFRYASPIRIDRTTVVRAAVPDVDSILQVDASATYLFFDDIVRQGAETPAGFPDDRTVNRQKMLYGLAKAVTEGDADTQARLRRGFTESIRTVSLVIDPTNLFDAASGIYVNATGNGRGWERPTMVEQINPADPSDEFAVPAGLRIRGAFSREAWCPKHSFRLFFRSEYGMGSLDHPLFGDEGADSFEKIDLRTSQDFSWANDEDDDTFIHECFSRDSERDMGSTYNRSRYYNLFINGVYWGLYQTEERVDQNYCESYNGGAADNYDVVRTSQPGYNTGIVEGESSAWTELWRITTQEGYGTGHAANYNRVRGLNPDGTRNADYPILLNVTNLIEHILTVHYTEDADSPVNSGGMANNIIAFRNRRDGEGKVDGFLWNRHDAEMSMRSVNTFNSLVYGTPEHKIANPKYDLRALGSFNPNLLSYELMSNAEYRCVFGDLVYRHMVRTGGALTPPVADARFRARMAEIDDAIVCESARWGHQYGKARTRETWLTNCNSRLSFIASRLTYLLAEYRRRGWYPSVDAPGAANGLGEIVTDGMTIAAGDRLYLTGGGAGKVYYTLDGHDPRAAGGAVSTGAKAYSGGLVIPPSGATVTMRVLSGSGAWSALEAVSVKGGMDWPSDPDAEITEATRPSDLGITAGAFADAEPAELRKLAKWAKANEVVCGGLVVNAMSFDADGNPATAVEAAYLLNCAVLEVEDERAEFRFTAIVPGVKPEIDGSRYNGRITVRGAETLEGPWSPDVPTARFYKAVLTR